MIENKDITEAIDRIAHTADGQILYRFLQKTLCAVSVGNIDDGALRQFEGRRMFASELMGHMAKGIEDSDRHAITFSVSGASRTATGARGAARRVTLDTAVSGWDSPDTTTGARGG